MNGRFADRHFQNTTAALFVIGINHNASRENASREGENLIHFELLKSVNTGNLICFTDNDYPYSGGSNSLRMNATADNSCGWEDSLVRYVLDSTTRPTSSTGLASILPDELKNVMKTATKYSYRVSTVASTSDYVSIFSEKEVFGTITRGPTSESNYQVQYEYYASGNSVLHYTMDNEPAYCWTRTIWDDSARDSFVIVYNDGDVNGYTATKSLGVSPLIFV